MRLRGRLFGVIHTASQMSSRRERALDSVSARRAPLEGVGGVVSLQQRQLQHCAYTSPDSPHIQCFKHFLNPFLTLAEVFQKGTYGFRDSL